MSPGRTRSRLRWLSLIVLLSSFTLAWASSTEASSECPEPGLCHHICIFQNGSLNCLCRDGHILAKNGRDCIRFTGNEVTASGSGISTDNEDGDDETNSVAIKEPSQNCTDNRSCHMTPTTVFPAVTREKTSTPSGSSADHEGSSASADDGSAESGLSPYFGWDCLDDEDCHSSGKTWLEDDNDTVLPHSVDVINSPTAPTVNQWTTPQIDPTAPDSKLDGEVSASGSGSGFVSSGICDDEDGCPLSTPSTTTAKGSGEAITTEKTDQMSTALPPVDAGSGSGSGSVKHCFDNVDDEDCIDPTTTSGESEFPSTSSPATEAMTSSPVTPDSASVTKKTSGAPHTDSTTPPPTSQSQPISNADPCNGVTCLHGGVCQTMPKRQFRCLCRLGRTGKLCDRVATLRHPSFTGRSYLVYAKHHNIYRKFEITIEFRASRLNGLLLYSGQTLLGNKDFFAVVLQNGRVEFRYDCGAGHVVIVSNVRLSLNTWHRVTVVRFGQKGWVQVDSENPVRGATKSWYSSIVTDQIYVGGLSNYTGVAGDVGVTAGLTGCVRKLVINGKYFHLHVPGDAVDGLDLGDCDAVLCQSARCPASSKCAVGHGGEATCLCPFGLSGDRCDQKIDIAMPQFDGSGFLKFEGLGLKARNEFVIEVIFKPSSTSGLVFYNGDGQDGKGDFISLALKHGFVEFRFDCGTGPAVLRSPSPLELGIWHTVRLSRQARKGSVTVDGGKTVVGVSKGSFSLLKLSSPLFVGGLKHFGEISAKASIHSHFAGCIQKIAVNSEEVEWRKPMEGLAVRSCSSHRCSTSPCGLNGTCEPRLHEFVCHCDLGYEGRFCDQASPFDVPSFDGHSFLRYSKSSILKSLKGLRSSLSLVFKTSDSEGLIVWFGTDPSKSSDWSDFLAIGLSNGHLSLQYDIGNGVEILNSTFQVNDNNWHDIHVTRKYREARLIVDNGKPIIAKSEGKSISLDCRADLHVGGLMDVPGTTSFRFRRGFRGCVRSLTIGDKKVDLYGDPSEGHHVQKC